LQDGFGSAGVPPAILAHEQYANLPAGRQRYRTPTLLGEM